MLDRVCSKFRGGLPELCSSVRSLVISANPFSTELFKALTLDSPIRTTVSSSTSRRTFWDLSWSYSCALLLTLWRRDRTSSTVGFSRMAEIVVSEVEENAATARMSTSAAILSICSESVSVSYPINVGCKVDKKEIFP